MFDRLSDRLSASGTLALNHVGGRWTVGMAKLRAVKSLET